MDAAHPAPGSPPGAPHLEYRRHPYLEGHRGNESRPASSGPLLDELRLGDARLGVEFDSYGLKAHYWRLMEAELAGRCTLTDASTLIDRSDR